MSILRLRTRVRAQVADPLMRSAYSLVASAVLTAVLGIAFWIAAARLYEPAELGRDAALIAVMMELSTICQLNLVNGLTRFLPGLERGTSKALLGAYGLSGAVSLVTGVALVAVAPLISPEFAFLRDDLWLAALYVLAQMAWVWFVLQDAALVALRRAPWVPLENAVFGVLKLAALPVLVLLGSAHGVFLAWVLPAVLLLVPVNVFLFRTAIPEHHRKRLPAGSFLNALGRRRLVGFMAQDWAATIVSQAAATMLPLLIIALVGPSANAYFYVPFTIVVAFNMLFYAATTALVVEGALAEERIRALAATLVRRFVFILIPGTALLAAAASFVMLPFGDDYVRESSSLLRLLAGACIFRAATVLYSALARLHGQGSRILAVEAAQAVLLLAGIFALSGPLGLSGVALAWLGSTAAVAIAIFPSLLRFFRSSPRESGGLGVVPRATEKVPAR
jgi:O-antigen/teichoic acid export membrane protein